MLLICVFTLFKRKFLRWFLKSLGTDLGSPGSLTWPTVVVGFFRWVILITYRMVYIAMQAVSLVHFFAQETPSVHMWDDADIDTCKVSAQSDKWFPQNRAVISQRELSSPRGSDCYYYYALNDLQLNTLTPNCPKTTYSKLCQT